jgi:hypothetical protein
MHSAKRTGCFPMTLSAATGPTTRPVPSLPSRSARCRRRCALRANAIMPWKTLISACRSTLNCTANSPVSRRRPSPERRPSGRPTWLSSSPNPVRWSLTRSPSHGAARSPERSDSAIPALAAVFPTPCRIACAASCASEALGVPANRDNRPIEIAVRQRWPQPGAAPCRTWPHASLLVPRRPRVMGGERAPGERTGRSTVVIGGRLHRPPNALSTAGGRTTRRRADRDPAVPFEYLVVHAGPA